MVHGKGAPSNAENVFPLRMIIPAGGVGVGVGTGDGCGDGVGCGVGVGTGVGVTVGEGNGVGVTVGATLGVGVGLGNGGSGGVLVPKIACFNSSISAPGSFPSVPVFLYGLVVASFHRSNCTLPPTNPTASIEAANEFSGNGVNHVSRNSSCVLSTLMSTFLRTLAPGQQEVIGAPATPAPSV